METLKNTALDRRAKICNAICHMIANVLAFTPENDPQSYNGVDSDRKIDARKEWIAFTRL